MRKRILDLLSQEPVLKVVSYGQAGPNSLTPAQREKVALTVRRSPEVMVKVSGGARTLAGVERHVAYVGRNGKLPVESDNGERLGNKGFEAGMILDWSVDVEAHQRQNGRAVRTVRGPPKLVHNIIFSMPAGTPPDRVLKAVRQLARQEFGFRHRQGDE
jgi:hypothetical protein